MDATLWKNHRLTILTIAFALILSGCGQHQYGSVNASALNGQQCTGQALQDKFLVKWRSAVPEEYQKYALYPGSLVTRFSATSKDQVEKEVLQKHLTDYEVAEYEFQIEKVTPLPTVATNDTGSITGTWGPSDIQTQAAWSFLGNKGDGIIVAVVDSGADINNPLIENNIWVNPGEIPGNGIDDDHDDLVDDVNGWDFNGNQASVQDLANHGTHVSGIIAGQAAANGFTGIAPNAKILPVKFIDGTGSGAIGDAISGINYAASKGAKVINASWGGSECSSILQQEILTVTGAGILFVNAAGNGNAQGIGQDINVAPEWPAAFQIPGKITVGSYNSAELLSTFSNYGILVDLAAPGENILSAVPASNGQAEGPNMAIKSGTSMATPFVSGVAALLYSARPSATAVQIAAAINGGVQIENFNVRTKGKLNALGAAQYLMSH
jgi:subtilisin family serine protease